MEWSHKLEKFWDEYTQEFCCTLWGAEAWFSITYFNNGQDCQALLDRFAEAADRCLGWLNVHQAEIFAAIDQDGLYATALEWLSDIETEEEDGITYGLLYDGVRLPLPYQKEDFFSSLVSSALSFTADHKSTEFILDMFIDTEPDVFAGHSIEVFLNGDFSKDTAEYTVKVNGLAG